MPAFQSLVKAGQKRTREYNADSESRKRQSLSGITDVDGSIIADDPTKAGEQYWMVQWQVIHLSWERVRKPVTHVYLGDILSTKSIRHGMEMEFSCYPQEKEYCTTWMVQRMSVKRAPWRN